MACNFGIVLCLATLIGVVANSSEEPELSDEQIKALIADLVSPNDAPKIRGPRAIYAESYDRTTQKKVFSTWHKLLHAGSRTFPHLIEHLDDRRYSFTEDGGSAMKNWSVGRACADIIRGNLQPYGSKPYVEGETDARMHPRRPGYFDHHKLYEQASAREWWKAHQRSSLLEMQIEALEWTLAAESKKPGDYSERETKYLQDFLDRARSSKLPLKPSVPYAR